MATHSMTRLSVNVIIGLSLSFSAVFPGGAPAYGGDVCDEQLAVKFTGKRGQVEVGGPFAGVEFHESRPLPSRI
ncbi:MAG: hypothetical protein OEM41_02535, partial [Ignavibacteria bacterium]|nr:hypothetical protein [Ignavibacteria bacterium]